MKTFSALLALCEGNSLVTGGFPSQKGFDVFFDLRLNKRLSKQSRRWWFETPSHTLWRHCNVFNWNMWFFVHVSLYEINGYLRLFNSSPPCRCRKYTSVNWVSIGSGNGLSPVRRPAITWINDDLFFIGLVVTNFSKIRIKKQNILFMKNIWKYCLRYGGQW